MPPGAKKRKALKKKQQQQQQHEPSIGTNTNSNGHGGNDEHGSQDDRESDSNLSSPGSQENQEFGGTKDPSAAAMVKETAKEISDVTQGLGPYSGNGTEVERGTDDKKTILVNSGNVIAVERRSSYESSTQTAKNVAPQDPCVKEITPVVDSVSKVVVSEKSEHAESPTHSNFVRDSEVPLSPEEKRLLLPGPPAVRTSWLSCCGLFDAMTGSDR